MSPSLLGFMLAATMVAASFYFEERKNAHRKLTDEKALRRERQVSGIIGVTGGFALAFFGEQVIFQMFSDTQWQSGDGLYLTNFMISLFFWAGISFIALGLAMFAKGALK